MFLKRLFMFVMFHKLSKEGSIKSSSLVHYMQHFAKNTSSFPLFSGEQVKKLLLKKHLEKNIICFKVGIR